MNTLVNQQISKYDYYNIITPGAFISNNAIRSAIKLIDPIKSSCNILLDTLTLQQTNDVNIDPMSQNTVTAIFNGYNHFLVLSNINNIDNILKIYDTLNTNYINNETKNIFKKSVPNTDVAILAPVMKQGENECGVLTIANIVLLATGIDPSHYHFDLSQARSI